MYYIMSFARRGKRKGARRRGKITLKKVNRKVNKIISSQEMKIFDGVFNLTPTVAGIVTWITPVVLGDRVNDREGNELDIKHLEVNYHVHKVGGVLDEAIIVRFMIFSDIQSTNGVIATNTLLQVANELHSPLNRASRGRIRILYDRYHVLNPTAGIINATSDVQRWAPTISYGVFKKKMNLKITFNANAVVAATGAGGERRHLFILLRTNNVAIATAVHGIVRILYKDN